METPTKLTVGDLLRALRQDYRAVLVILAVTIGASIVLALVTPATYRSEAVVAPTPDDGGAGALAGLASQFGGLAALAGVSVGKGGNWQEAIATLRSRHLIEELVRQDELLPVLFADRWDGPAKSWRASLGRGAPTMGDAVQLFERKILQVREDLKSGLVTVRVEWRDPELAARWANDLVALADAELRGKSIANASAALEALSVEFRNAEAVELRTAVARLIEAQLKSKLVAGIRKEYAFRVIDRAVASDRDKRVFPTRTAIVIAGGLLGGVLSFLWVVMRRSWR
ncbi:MAG: hypothetical protein JSR73_02755 [Proteobacteria bacterium]|nr:hypothetical protein [Pseudomonadota bacterium]